MFMKKFLFMAVISACMSISAATAQTEEKFPCYVEVSGYAERNVTPDTFYLNIVIAEKDSKGKISVDTQQRDMMRALQSLGIDTEKQLTMVDMSGEYFKKNNTLVTAQYRLKLSSAADVRKVCSALSDIGISSVTMRSVSYSKIDEVRNEMRVQAMRNAREKAAMLAEAVGQKVGECIRINDYSRDVTEEAVTLNARMFKAAGNADADFAVEEEPLEFKPIKVSGSVNARFVLLNGKGGNIFYH